MPYRYLSELTMADVAFEAEGRDLNEVFALAADATLNAMIEDIRSVRREQRRTIVLEDSELDLLLHQLLQELVYFKDAERLLLRISEIEVSNTNGTWRLRAEAEGEPLDPERHETSVDVKAVTLHEFRLMKTDTGWKATVVLDV